MSFTQVINFNFLHDVNVYMTIFFDILIQGAQ
jgi:hypothetical protein